MPGGACLPGLQIMLRQADNLSDHMHNYIANGKDKKSDVGPTEMIKRISRSAPGAGEKDIFFLDVFCRYLAKLADVANAVHQEKEHYTCAEGFREHNGE